MIDLSGQRVVVVGLGASGIAAAELCVGRGARVTATDSKTESAFDAPARAAIERLRERGVRLVLGGHAGAEFEGAGTIVVSPGVPSFPELQAAEARGVAVIGEVELSVRALVRGAPVIAIGGTNGKSTTTSLVGAILQRAGRRTFVGGNLGEPLSRHADAPWDAIVLEVSSFQLERAPTFRPRVSVLLNITEDHLDRYEDFAAYARAKGNAFAQQESDDVAVVPFGDVLCEGQARRGRGAHVTFGAGGDVDVTPDAIVDRRSGDAYPRGLLSVAGDHNAANVAAAIAVVRALDVGADTIASALRTFRGLPHRMVLVRELDAVRYYDDSKGTNVGASVTALSGLPEPRAVLIAGGRDKGGSYAPLAAALGNKGRAIVLIGEASDAIARAIAGVVPVHRARTLDDAVAQAQTLAHRGDAVLLSPACSSYDMFRDYKHRGDEFARAVAALTSRSET